MIVFDIDNTLSIVGDRLKCLKSKDWDSFYARCGEDLPNAPIVKLYQDLQYLTNDVIVVTGRREMCRLETIKWFNKYDMGLISDNLYMRDNDDRRPDTVVKFEKIDGMIDNVSLVFEDRDCMVKAWRDRGVTCCQVAEGNF